MRSHYSLDTLGITLIILKIKATYNPVYRAKFWSEFLACGWALINFLEAEHWFHRLISFQNAKLRLPYVRELFWIRQATYQAILCTLSTQYRATLWHSCPLTQRAVQRVCSMRKRTSICQDILSSQKSPIYRWLATNDKTKHAIAYQGQGGFLQKIRLLRTWWFRQLRTEINSAPGMCIVHIHFPHALDEEQSRPGSMQVLLIFLIPVFIYSLHAGHQAHAVLQVQGVCDWALCLASLLLVSTRWFEQERENSILPQACSSPEISADSWTYALGLWVNQTLNHFIAVSFFIRIDVVCHGFLLSRLHLWLCYNFSSLWEVSVELMNLSQIDFLTGFWQMRVWNTWERTWTCLLRLCLPHKRRVADLWREGEKIYWNFTPSFPVKSLLPL